MKRTDAESVLASVETDAEQSRPRALVESHLQALEERLAETPAEDSLRHGALNLEAARQLLELGRLEEAWARARTAFDTFMAGSAWEPAVEATEVLFLAEQPGSLAALGQGIWLAVTFPVNPDVTVAMLQHVIDETPDDADGAAVAAATAHYVVDLRAEGRQREELEHFSGRMLAAVARRHSGVDEQSAFDDWVQRLELDRPDAFLVRLRNVVDVMVQDEWWFDRDAIRQVLPVN